jgi:hypothetical protein
MNVTQTSIAEWQCVLICWGDKYGVDIINRLVASVELHCTCRPRFVLITDRDRPGLPAHVQCVPFPEHWLEPALKRSGCQAKLVMFEEGILQTDLPAIYIDLDTIVMGDMSRLLALQHTPQSVAILPSAILPFGALARWLYARTRQRKYARGNSSVVVFHPAHCHYIASRFRALYVQFPEFGFRPMIADERFISWVAQAHMQAISKAHVAKFPGEYMFYWSWWLYVKARLPWVKARRRAQLAVTLNGLMIKPERLLALSEGDVIVDEKNRKLVWSRHTLGSMQETILCFYGTAATQPPV